MAELKYFKKFNTKSDYDTYIDGTPVLPNVSIVADEDVYFTPSHDYSSDYFTTIALEDGTISFNIWRSMGTDYITSISYSTDGGETWVTTQNQNNKSAHLVINVNVNEGDRVLWKGIAQQTGYYDEDDYAAYVGSFFSSTAEFDAEGNVMSLLYGDNFINETELEYVGQFTHLFHDYDGEKECLVVNTENLILPATTLANSCYLRMFNGCTGLISAPELPATTLANNCYNYMFQGCTNLNYIKCLATDISASNCTSYWVNGVSSTGTFVKNANMSSWTTGNNGIPNNWTVQDAS